MDDLNCEVLTAEEIVGHLKADSRNELVQDESGFYLWAYGTIIDVSNNAALQALSTGIVEYKYTKYYPAVRYYQLTGKL